MNYDEALKLLEEYNGHNSLLINHCKAVSSLAYDIAKKIKEKGIKVDIEKVRVAALLHDVGRFNGTEGHDIEGGKLLRNKGKKELAEIIERHGSGFELSNDESHLPKTIEDKIVIYSDSRVDFDKVVTIEERIESLRRRYTGNKRDILEKTVKRHEKLIREIEDMLNE